MKQKAEPVTASFNTQTKTDKILRKYLKKATIFVVVIVAVLIAAVIGIEYKDNHEIKTNVCSTSLIKQSYVNLYNRASGPLADNAKTIQSLDGYQRDPNCMYIMTVYYVQTYNITKANSSLKLFNTAYSGSGNKLNSLLQQYASPTTLKALVNSLNATEQQTQKNFQMFSPPSSKASRVPKS
ncbi:MAG: hypothetical protein WDN66_04030 [Candidatus Saccharibacteria bacterium]